MIRPCRAVLIAGVALTSYACDKGGPLTASPLASSPSVSVPSPSSTWTSWTGNWTFEQAIPADNCMTDALNSRLHARVAPLTLSIGRHESVVEMAFFNLYDDDVGYLPRDFVGTVDDAGQITASPSDVLPGHIFYDPWRAWCYGAWTIIGGELSGAISENMHEFSGVIVETFREVPQGPVFTVRSRFTATRP